MDRIDEIVGRLERILIVMCVAGMTLLVAADVTQRTFSRPVGKTEQLVVFVAERLFGPLTQETRALCEGVIADAVFVIFALLALSFATHASRQTVAKRRKTRAPRRLRSVFISAGIFVVGAACVKLLLWLFPSSVPGAQRFALALMLWAGMLGASVATKEHSHCLRATAVNLYRQTSDGATARKMVGHAKDAEDKTVRNSTADDEERIAIQRRAFGGALRDTKRENAW